jgi:hypothetical protein
VTNPKDLVGVKKAALRFVPPALAIEASGPMADGAEKYGPFNWRAEPVEVVGYIEAVFRHLYAYLDGQDNAEDSGHSHIGHAIAGLGIVADAASYGTLIDNRYHAGPAADMLRARDKSAKQNEVLVLVKSHDAVQVKDIARLYEAANAGNRLSGTGNPDLDGKVLCPSCHFIGGHDLGCPRYA